MASKSMVIGTGAALAGVGGLAAAAVTTNPPAEKTVVKTVAQPVETRTVVIRTVEHRTKRIKPKHHAVHAAAAAAAPVVHVAPAVVRTAPVVQAAPVAVRHPVIHTHAIRTHTSGGTRHAGGGEREGGSAAGRQDD